jgi:hypothetical protein
VWQNQGFDWIERECSGVPWTRRTHVAAQNRRDLSATGERNQGRAEFFALPAMGTKNVVRNPVLFFFPYKVNLADRGAKN